MSTLQTLLPIVSNLSRWQTMAANTPAAKTATAYFEANIGKVTSAADLVKDPRLFGYAMTAFGMSDRTYAKSLMTQAMTGGITNTSSLANKISDANIYAFTQAFDFGDNGSSITSSQTLVAQVVAKYNEATLETQQGQSNTGVQLALHFLANATNIKTSYDILADKNMLSVVQTALNISPESAFQDIDTQAAQITKQLNVADFQEPTKLTKFVQKFAAQYDVQQSQANTPTNVLMLDTTSDGAADKNALSMLDAVNGTGQTGSATSSVLSLFNTSSSTTTSFDQSFMLKMQGFNAVV